MRGKGPERGHLPGPRGRPLRLAPVSPGLACAPRRRLRPLREPSGWGWGWGADPSPDCPGRRRPSFSCPRARAHPAGSAGPPWRCARRGRGRCPPAALPASRPRAVRVRRPPRSRTRPPPRPTPPRPGPTRPRWLSRQAGRQGPLRSCRAPPALPSAWPLSPPRAADLRLRGRRPGTPAPPGRPPRRRRTQHPARTGPTGALSLRPGPAGPTDARISSPRRRGEGRLEPRLAEAWGAGRTQRANNWKLLIVNALRMVPAASWLSRAASQAISGSHFCPGGKRAPTPFILKGTRGGRGNASRPGLGAQRNRSWPQRAGKFSVGAEWPSNQMRGSISSPSERRSV